MRDLDRIKSRKSYGVDRQKISIILATGIVVGMTIFTVGLYLGLRKPGDAQAATADPLEQLIASAPASSQDQQGNEREPLTDPASLRYHELLENHGDAEEASGDPEEMDVDAPMPVDVDESPIPMPGEDKTVTGSFNVPSVPSDTAFEEPTRIPLSKPGGKGVYTVHVNSFSEKASAAGYVKQLRKSGYKAFLVETHSESRGTLYRVRIGPFYSHKAAFKFSKSFEKKEGVPTYIVKRVIED